MSTAAFMAWFGLAWLAAVELFVGLPILIWGHSPAFLGIVGLCILIWLAFCGLLRVVGGPE